jgi:hypothetical protein
LSGIEKQGPAAGLLVSGNYEVNFFDTNRTGR